MALADDISDLLATFPEADRATMLAAFERNPNAATHLTQRETVYKAFVDGDTSALANATRTVTPPVVTSPAVDLDAINRTLAERMGKIFDDPMVAAAMPDTPAPRMTTLAQRTPGTPHTSTPRPPPGRMR